MQTVLHSDVILIQKCHEHYFEIHEAVEFMKHIAIYGKKMVDANSELTDPVTVL